MSARIPHHITALGCMLALAGCGQASHHATSTAPAKTTPVPTKIQTGGAPIGLLAFNGALWVA